MAPRGTVTAGPSTLPHWEGISRLDTFSPFSCQAYRISCITNLSHGHTKSPASQMYKYRKWDEPTHVKSRLMMTFFQFFRTSENNMNKESWGPNANFWFLTLSNSQKLTCLASHTRCNCSKHGLVSIKTHIKIWWESSLIHTNLFTRID